MKIDNNLLNELGNSNTSIVKALEDNEVYQKISINKIFNYAIANWKNSDRIDDLIIFAHKYDYLKGLINNKKFSDAIINFKFPLIKLKALVKNNTEIYRKIMLKINENKKLFIKKTVNYSLSKYLDITEINKPILKINSRNNSYDY